MTQQLMTRCETKRLYKVNGNKEWRWVDVAVADIAPDSESQIRCAHCHGAVKVVKGNEHVAHRSRADADNCQGGQAQSLSSRPVT